MLDAGRGTGRSQVPADLCRRGHSRAEEGPRRPVHWVVARGRPMTAIETPVLIVRGGRGGFVLGLALARRGTRSTLSERDAGTGLEILAKPGTLNERTMEYSRWLGIRDAIVNVGFPD